MRVLFDEQLSESLLQRLADVCPAAVHVRPLGLGGAADEVVWPRAVDLGCVLVTKDEDFHRLSVLKGAPQGCLVATGQLHHGRPLDWGHLRRLIRVERGKPAGRRDLWDYSQDVRFTEVQGDLLTYRGPAAVVRGGPLTRWL